MICAMAQFVRQLAQGMPGAMWENRIGFLWHGV
jgi:hypothetical protein